MYYKVLNSGKLRIQKAFINFLLIISCITTLSSCTTTQMTSVSPESLESGSQGKITKIELKNGTIINCKNKGVKIESKSDSTGFFVITSADTVKTGSNRIDIQMKEQRIAKKDVLKIQMENTETDTTNTVFLVLGIAAGAALAYFIVLVVAINGADLK